MATDTQMVRLSRETKDRLDALIATLLESRERTDAVEVLVTKNNQPGHKGISYDALICYLLDVRAKDKARVARAKAAARARRREGKGGAS